MVIVDSSVWIDALNNRATPQTDWLSNALNRRPVGLTSLILCEVLRGIRSDGEFKRAQQQLQILHVFENATAPLAISAAQNFRTLQRKGITVRKTIDCLIATFCIEEGYELLHNDRDFDAFEAHLGLRVKHP
jgi:predicted nucleic acid-binding protein